jgi:hypothetical protein
MDFDAQNADVSASGAVRQMSAYDAAVATEKMDDEFIDRREAARK